MHQSCFTVKPLHRDQQTFEDFFSVLKNGFFHERRTFTILADKFHYQNILLHCQGFGNVDFCFFGALQILELFLSPRVNKGPCVSADMSESGVAFYVGEHALLEIG